MSTYYTLNSSVWHETRTIWYMRKIHVTVSEATCVLVLTKASLIVSAFDCFKIITNDLWLLRNVLWEWISQVSHFYVSVSKVAGRSKLAVPVFIVSANARLVFSCIASRRVYDLRASTAIEISILNVGASIWK